MSNNSLTEAFIEILSNPRRQLEKRDQQIDKIFDVENIDEKYRKKIQDFFKIVGSKIQQLNTNTIEVLARQLKYLSMKIEDDEEDKRCNDIIARNHLTILRACYMELGIDPDSVTYNSDEQKAVIDSLSSIEKTKILSESNLMQKSAREKELKKFINDGENYEV